MTRIDTARSLQYAARLLFLVLQPGICFFNNIPVGSEYAGVLGAGSSAGTSRLAGTQNPASHKASHRGISLNYYNPFQIPDLKISEISGYWDGPHLGTGFHIQQTQVNESYIEQSISLQGSAGLFKKFRGGLSGSLRRLEIKNFGSKMFFSVSTGVTFKLHPKFVLGLFLKDFQSYLGYKDYSQPVFQMGNTFKGKHTVISFDVTRNRYGKWSNVIGQSINIGKSFTVSLGLADSPYRYSLGVKIRFAGAGVSTAIQIHEYLGQTIYYGFFSEFENADSIKKGNKLESGLNSK